MFRLLTPVVIHFTLEARPVLGDQLRPACMAAWKAIAQSRMGLEFAYLPFLFQGTPLALFSRLRSDGVIIIELGLDDGRHPHRIIAAPVHCRALAQVQVKSGRFGASPPGPLAHSAVRSIGGC